MKKPEIIIQSVMLRMLYSMVPVFFAAVYYFGLRVLVLIIVSCLFAFVTEWVVTSQNNRKITSACFVTAGLYSLSLPPTTPFWIAAVGAVVAILFGKETFGGFGRNVFNPAIVGRAFVYICFPIELSSKFVPTFSKFPGGFIRWDFISLQKGPKEIFVDNVSIGLDAVSSATPLIAAKQLGFITEPIRLITGNIGQIFNSGGINYTLAAGSCGEVCSLAILLSLIYLLYTKTIQYRLFLGTIIGAVLLVFIWSCLTGFKSETPSIIFTLFSGGLLYAAVFMVTEPVTAPKNKKAQWLYSIFIGSVIVLLRTKSSFAGGVAFSILLGNMISPSLDIYYKRIKQIKNKF